MNKKIRKIIVPQWVPEVPRGIQQSRAKLTLRKDRVRKFAVDLPIKIPTQPSRNQIDVQNRLFNILMRKPDDNLVRFSKSIIHDAEALVKEKKMSDVEAEGVKECIENWMQTRGKIPSKYVPKPVSKEERMNLTIEKASKIRNTLLSKVRNFNNKEG